jgi:hypothetical protein
MWNRKRVVAGLAVASIVVAGCSETAPTEPIAQVPETASLFGGVVNPQAHESRDARLVRVSETVPGYGGHFFDETGALNVFMTGAAQMRTASALRGELGALGISLDAQPVRMVAGQYTFAELDGMHQRARAVLGIGGVVYTDVDDRLNRLAIGVESSTAAADVRNALDVLGVPAAAVVIRETEPIMAMQTLRDRVRPVAGGLQINFPGFLCTLGFNVRSPQAPNVHGFVTNSHCSNNMYGTGPVGTPYWQPSGSVASPADPNFIGTEVHDLPLFTGGACPAGRQCRWSDAAGVQYASGVNNAFARIYRTTGPGSITIDPTNPQYTIVAERAFPSIGDQMIKVGRTTGMSQGPVVGSCQNVNVGGTPIPNLTLLCQERVTATVAGGDSGSPVFDIAPGGGPNNVRLTGILWGGGGGDFIFSAMSEVRFENTPPPGLTWVTH